MTEYNDLTITEMESVLATFVERAHEYRSQEAVLGAVRLLCKKVGELEKQMTETVTEVTSLGVNAAQLERRTTTPIVAIGRADIEKDVEMAQEIQAAARESIEKLDAEATKSDARNAADPSAADSETNKE